MNHCFGLWFLGMMASTDFPTDDVAAWGKWGLAGVIIMYTLWRDWDREKRMSAALDARDEWTKEQMLLALKENSAALKDHAAAGDRQTAILTEVAKKVAGCPNNRR